MSIMQPLKSLKSKHIRIGTRSSQLAIVQANIVSTQLHDIFGDKITTEIVKFETTGDKITDRALLDIGGKGLFTQEIEAALLENTIDCAVHSAKDMLTTLPEGLVVAAITTRKNPSDILIGRNCQALSSIYDLPKYAKIGTSSLRRASQLKYLRPDLQITTFRGNVNTRLQKLMAGKVDATLLAYSGLERLGMTDLIQKNLSLEEMLPAVGQGSLAIETRKDDWSIRSIIRTISDSPSMLEISAERALLKHLEGDCRTPIAAYAKTHLSNNQIPQLTIEAKLTTPCGSRQWCNEVSGAAIHADIIGKQCAEEIIEMGGYQCLEQVKAMIC